MGKMKELAIKLIEQQQLNEAEAAYIAGLPHEQFETKQLPFTDEEWIAYHTTAHGSGLCILPNTHFDEQEDAEIRAAIEADDIDPEYDDYLNNHGQGHCPHCDGAMSAYEQESFGYCGECYEGAQQSIQNWDRSNPE